MNATDELIELTKSTSRELSTWTDQDLLDVKDSLSVKLQNIRSQENAYREGNLIGYDEDWFQRLHGAKCHTREELQAFKIELRKRGLLTANNISPYTDGSRKQKNRRKSALIRAIFEILGEEKAGEIIARRDEIVAEWEAEAE